MTIAASSQFRPLRLPTFPDALIYGARLHDLMDAFGGPEGLDLTTPSGHRVICAPGQERSLKNVRVGFSGKAGRIEIGRLRGVYELDIACIKGSVVSIGDCSLINGATIMASAGAKISIGSGGIMSRDVMIYASGAHRLFSLSDGERRGAPEIEIGSRVWLGQGCRILAGARVGDGSVIGSYAVLAGKIPANCAAAGNPCRVTTEGIGWSNS